MYDIAIIGAGPGGCACALALQQSGLKVILIDKDIFPRDKVCGDAIPGPAFKAMNTLNPIWGAAMKSIVEKHEIKTGQVFAANGRTMKIDWVTYSYNSKRFDFDHFLFQLVASETNTVLKQNSRVKDLKIEKTHAVCTLEDDSMIHASLVIGCDGANSVVRRKLVGNNLNNDHACSAVRAYYKGVEGIQPGVNEFHFFKELLPGYFWIFPLDNGWVNIGFGILQQKIGGKKRPINLRQAMNTIITEIPSITSRFKNATLMADIKSFGLPLGIHQNSLSGERYMLCGDAGSLIDPLQGHGIDHAMNSGILAARHAVKCIENNKYDVTFMKEYDVSVYKKIGGELKRNTFLLRLLSRAPWLLDLATIFGKHQKLMEKIVRRLGI